MATFRCQGQRWRSAFISKSSTELGASHQTHRCGKRGGKSMFVAGGDRWGTSGEAGGPVKEKMIHAVY